MKENWTSENPETNSGFPITHSEVVEILVSDTKKKLLNSDGTSELNPDEFSDTYLTLAAEKEVIGFNKIIDNDGIIIIRPVTWERKASVTERGFDIKPIIAGVKGDMQKIMWAGQQTTRIRKSIRSAAANPQ